MKLISWNVAGRGGKLTSQAEVLAEQRPDVVALQEVTGKTVERWRDALTAMGFDQIHDTADLLGEHRYCNLIASRWPSETFPPLEIAFPERGLSATIHADEPARDGAFELHVLHAPDGSSHGLAKVEAFEALYERLARPSELPRVLCGDFNTPQLESSAGEVTTWGQRHPEHFDRWKAAELSILKGLEEFDLPDAYRGCNGYPAEGFNEEGSWVKGEVHRRYDHVFASPDLDVRGCRYIHDWRQDGLSDHSAIEAVFDPTLPQDAATSEEH